MKRIILLPTILIFLASIGAAFALDNVIITEVLYDPANTDSGGEAVQLYNPTASPLDISGWVLKTKTSATDATIPSSAILQPNSYYLIADAGWSASKDNPSLPDANHEEAITLANADAGVALINNGTIIDAVGWGDSSIIPAGLFEGTPALEVAEGKSLKRKQVDNEYVDSDNNSADFMESVPGFKTNQSNSLILTIEAIITGAAPIIESIEIMDEDETTNGIQISPVPKQNKTINVKAKISDSNGLDDLKETKLFMGIIEYELMKIDEIDSATAYFETNITMPYYYSAGNYLINITAADYSDFSASETRTIEYLGLVAVELDTSHIIFSADAGTITEIMGDNDMSTADKPTIRNIGNEAVDIELFGTNLSAEQETLPVTEIFYSFGNGFINLTNTKQTQNLNIEPGTNANIPFSLKLNVPLGTKPGNYFGSINIAGVTS